MTDFAGERIAKVMARAGLCSRREAERLIAEGKVSVNGKKLTSAARNVTAGDRIEVAGASLPRREETRLWRYHKPPGLVVSHRDPQGRPSVFDRLRQQLPRVVSVGRLDLTTEGLLLLTNDGGLARALEHPSAGFVRRYRVRAYGKVDEAMLARIAGGVEIGGVRYGPVAASIDQVQGDNVWLNIAITEGKNREVRNICEYLGLRVNRLIRVAFGPFTLGELRRGGVEEVPPRVMRHELGPIIGKPHANRRRKTQGS